MTAVIEKTTHHVRNYAVGTFRDDGTVAATKVETGFRPRYVRVVNLDDRTEMEHFVGMDDATGLKTVADGTRTLAATNGITVHDDGFTIGLDTDVLVTEKDLAWIAVG